MVENNIVERALKKRKKKDTLSAYLFLAPSLFIYCCFVLIPLVMVFYLTFYKYNVITPAQWNDYKNFIRLGMDSRIKLTIWNSFKMVLLICLMHIVFSLALAVGVHSIKNRFAVFGLRTMLYFPVLVSVTAVALAWKYIFSADFGVINWFLGLLGIDAIPWLQSSFWAYPAFMIFSLWKNVGLYFLYFYIAIQGIDKSVLEAAELDGAVGFRRFIKITFPMISPTTFFVVVAHHLIPPLVPFAERRFISVRKYKNTMQHADFPLGGIGTGTITLTAAGRLIDFQIFNRPSLGATAPYTFFSMYSKVGEKTDTRVLEAEPYPDFYHARGYHPMHTMGLPKFTSSEMEVQYPFANIAFADANLPLKVKLCAFTPFIPMHADDSGIPGAVFRYEVENTSTEEAEVLIASSMGNVHNYHGADCFDNYQTSEACENIEKHKGKIAGVFLTGNAVSEDDLAYGNTAILTMDEDSEVRDTWFRGGWYDGITDFWNNLTKGKLAVEKEEGTSGFSVVSPMCALVGSVGVRRKIAPGKKEHFTFFMTWYMPNRFKGWFAGDNPGQTMKNYYASLYSDAWDVGCKLAERLEELEGNSRRFANALYATTLPEAVVDALAANIAVLRSTTCWRTPDGTFVAWEGSHEQEGSCHGSCTHVWNYAQTVAFLFPELEQSTRKNEFLWETDEDGKMSFRCRRRFDLPAWDMYAATDGQYGTIMRAWREWKLGGDRAYLEEIYPAVLSAFDYGLREWDADGDGVPDSRQHNTYDIEFFGPNPLSTVMMLGATRAIEEMAKELGDDERVSAMQAQFQKTRDNFEKLCWQGEYYVQKLDDVDKYPYQFGAGCLTDQLLGQTIAYICGLGALLPEDRLASAANAIYRYNFLAGKKRNPCLQRLFVADDEDAMVLCTWPNGGIPRFPFVYSDEVWTGIEYQVATMLVYQGMEDKAVTMVEAIRKRFDGVRRSPWSEMECGHYYARAMASWGLLVAMSGFDCNVAHSEMTFAPTKPGRTLFWSMGGAWGNISFCNDCISLRCDFGALKLRKLCVPELDRIYRVRVGCDEKAYRIENGALFFQDDFKLACEQTLSIELA